MISLVISSPFFVDEVAPHDRVVRDSHVPAVGDGERELDAVGTGDRAAKALAAVDVVSRSGSRPCGRRALRKCAGVRSGRSIPGDETSTVYRSR